MDAPAGLPSDIWLLVFDALIREVSNHRPLLPDSNIEPLCLWIPTSRSSAPARCLPHNCCHTERGARSGQAQVCSFPRNIVRSGLASILHVRKSLRALLLHYRPYLDYYRFLDPACQARDYPIESPNLIVPVGLCLCAIPQATAFIRSMRKLRLTLPSTDDFTGRSPARAIMEALLQFGAPALEDVELRFDWAEAHNEDRRKTIITASNVRTYKALNCSFVIRSDVLAVLQLASEEDFFTYNCADICDILRGCPRLRDLKLLSVFSPACDDWDFRKESPIPLEHLTSLHVRDNFKIWTALRHILYLPRLTHVHVDIILATMRATSDPELSAFANEVLDGAILAATFCPPLLLARKFLALSLHFQRDADETFVSGLPKPHNWPEYMQVALSETAECLLDAPRPEEESFTFTVRSDMTSSKAYRPQARSRNAPGQVPGAIFEIFWFRALHSLHCVGPAARGPFMNRVYSLVLHVDDISPSPIDWHHLLVELPHVVRLYLSGIRRDGPGLIRFSSALGTWLQGEFTLADALREVHLLDWEWRHAAIPVDRLQAAYSVTREFNAYPIQWFSS